MNKINAKIKIILLAGVFILSFAGDAQAATTIYSPANNSSFTVNTNITFRWNRTSLYNYIIIWNESWGPWINLYSATSYGPITRSTTGWLGAQVATWENNSWQYSNVVWVYFYTPAPPPPPPVPAPTAPTLSRSPNDPVYKGDTVAFSWDKPANTADFYIAYRRDNIWDANWTWVGLQQSQNFSNTLNLNDLAAQVAACNASGCGYSNIPVIALQTRVPSQMNLTPLVSGNNYIRSLSGSSDVKYEKITNATGLDQIYSAKITTDTANTTIIAVDGNGNASPIDTVSFSQGHIILKVAPGEERYLKFTGTGAGNYSFIFNRFRNIPYFEGP